MADVAVLSIKVESDAVRRASSDLAAFVKSGTNAELAMKSLTSSASLLKSNISVGNSAAWMKQYSTGAIDLSKALGLPYAAALKLQERMAQTQSANAQINSLRAIGMQAGLTTSELRKLGSQMGMTKETLKGLDESASGGGMGGGFFGGGMLGRVSMITAKVMLLQQALEMVVRPIVAIAEASMKMEKLQVGFAAVTGSADNAGETLSFVREEADRLGINFFSVADSYKKFIAATSSSKTPLEELRNIFTSFTEAGVVLGSTTQDQTRIFNALQQMYSKTFVSSEELRQQLGDSLPGAISLMAQAMGVSEQRLMKMLEQSEVLAKEAIPALARIIKEVYGRDVDAASQTGEAAVNRMVNAWDRFKASIADSEGIKSTLNLLTGLLNAAAGVADFVGGGKTDASLKETLAIRLRIDDLRKKEANALYDDERAAFASRRVELEKRLLVEMTKNYIAAGKALPKDSWLLRDEGMAEANLRADKMLEEQRKKMAPTIEKQRTATASLREELAKANDVGTDGAGKLAELNKKYNEYARNLGVANPLVREYAALIKYANDHNGNTPKEVEKANRAIDENIALLKEEMSIRGATQNLYGSDYSDTIAMMQAQTAAQKAYVKAKADGATEEKAAQLRSLSLQNAQLKLDEQRAQSAKTIAAGFSGTAYDAAVKQTKDQYDLAAKSTTDIVALERAKNAKLAQMEIARLRATGDAWDGMKAAAMDYAESAMNSGENMAKVFDNAFKGMEDALTDFVTTGKMSFSSLAESIMKDLVRMQIRESITGPLAAGIKSGGLWSGIMSLFSANGNVLSGPGISALSGGVYNQPTAFGYNQHMTAFANGGVLGEAGPEAVMPLARTSDGKLGVRTTDESKSGGTQTVTVIMKDAKGNQTAAPMSFNTNGMRQFILEVVRDGSARGLLGTA